MFEYKYNYLKYSEMVIIAANSIVFGKLLSMLYSRNTTMLRLYNE